MKRKVINCFYSDSHGGIGDFLRGSIFLYKFCKDRKIDFFLSIKHHGISKFIKTKGDFEYKEEDIIDVYKISNKSLLSQIESTKNLYQRVAKETKQTVMQANGKTEIFMYTNYSNLFLLNEKDVMGCINHTENLKEDCKDWFRENFVFSKLVSKKAEDELCRLKLKEKQFDVVHFRVGDERSFFNLQYSSRSVDFNSIFLICEKKIKANQKPLLILSDNNELKKYIVNKAKEKQLPIFCTHFESQHTQKKTSYNAEKETQTSEQGDFNVALDMKLVTMSRQVDSYSNYFWGSGFVTWISKIYNIPFKSSGI